MTRTEREEYWRQHLEAASCHTASIRSYCDEQGISEATFYYWKRKLSSSPSPWIELPPPPAAGLAKGPLLSAEFNGLRLDFHPGCPPEWAAVCCAALAVSSAGEPA